MGLNLASIMMKIYQATGGAGMPGMGGMPDMGGAGPTPNTDDTYSKEVIAHGICFLTVGVPRVFSFWIAYCLNSARGKLHNCSRWCLTVFYLITLVLAFTISLLFSFSQGL